MKKYLFLFLLFLASPLFAREFPLCIYGVSDPQDLGTLKEVGFSCVQTYQTEPEKLAALAQEAQKQGMKVVFYPNKILGTSYEKEAQAWPILAWYLVDEPDVHKWSRKRVKKAHEQAKKVFPQHDTALVIGQGITLVPFYDLTDVMMMDWYPVPHLKLTSFGDNVRYTKRGMEKKKRKDHALWGVVQIFDWKTYKQRRPDNDRIGRFPTEDEIRFMSFHGILNGATGLFYFTLSPGGKKTATQSPNLWKRVTAVTQQLHKLLPVLEEGILTDNPIFVADPLQIQTRLYDGKKYVFLLNTSDQEQGTPSEFLNDKYQLLYGSKTKTIPPYGVWVLKYP